MRLWRMLGLILMIGLVGCASGNQAVGTTVTVVAQVPTALPTTSVPATPTTATLPTATLIPTAVPTVPPSATPPPPTDTVVPLPSPTPSASATATPVPATATTVPSPSPTINADPTTIAGGAKPTPDIATTTPTSIPSEAPTTVQVAPGVIFFVAEDGATIKTIRADGSDEQTLLTVTKEAGQTVGNLAAEPSGTYLLYGVDTVYSLVQRGRATPITNFASIPRWSPEGVRFVGAEQQAPDKFPVLYLYDTKPQQGRSLGVTGFAPDWFPNGQSLVYVAEGEVWRYDLASEATVQLTNFPDAPEEAWAVQEAHVLPDGQHIIFFGGQGNTLGASGNGQQWWYIPVAGGEPQKLTEPGGNYVSAYTLSPNGDWITYSESAHSSACISIQKLTIWTSDVLGGVALDIPITEVDEQNERYAYIQGVSWAPDDDHLIFAVQPYACTPEGQSTETPVIYTWSLSAGTNPIDIMPPRKLINGSYPVWTR